MKPVTESDYPPPLGAQTSCLPSVRSALKASSRFALIAVKMPALPALAQSTAARLLLLRRFGFFFA